MIKYLGSKRVLVPVLGEIFAASRRSGAGRPGIRLVREAIADAFDGLGAA